MRIIHVVMASFLKRSALGPGCFLWLMWISTYTREYNLFSVLLPCRVRYGLVVMPMAGFYAPRSGVDIISPKRDGILCVSIGRLMINLVDRGCS